MTDPASQEFVDLLIEQNKKLDDIIKNGSENFRRYRRKATIGFAILTLGIAAALYMIVHNQNVGDKRDAAARAQIQDERASSIMRSCREQNARHDKTISELDRLLKLAVVQRPEDVARIRRSRNSTVALIDALVPVKDCRALVEQRVRTQ